MAKPSSLFRRPKAMMRLTDNSPRVSVPVLSNTTSSICPKASSAFLPPINTPSLASAPVEAASAVGVASDKAHGQVITNSATVIHKAVWASAYKVQPINTGTAKINSAATKLEAYFSANSATRGFCANARSSSFTICDKRVSLPTVSVRIISGLAALSVPAITLSSTRLATGRLSPVSMASLTSLSPDKTVPSTGITSPGFTTIISPRCNLATTASSVASLFG